MFYREAGQLAQSYAADNRLIPIRQDRWFIIGLLLFGYLVFPWLADEYMFASVAIPILTLSLGAVGLNILTGYTGQLSLGSAAFMAFGAFGTYNMMLRVEWMNLVPALFVGGLWAGVMGIIFGLPAIRIKGFYLLVSTLAAQFFAIWFFTDYPYFLNYASSGVVSLPPDHYDLFGFNLLNPEGKYFLTLTVVVIMTIMAKNMMRGSFGRNCVAVRDRDTAASVIGIPVPRTKLIAFFVSSFYLGVAGGLYVYAYQGVLDVNIFGLDRSFLMLFMVIIGGLGSILGSFFGAVFVYYFPILFNIMGNWLTNGALDSAFIENTANIIYGAFIVILLIRAPGGFASLWQGYKNKFRTWPFTH